MQTKDSYLNVLLVLAIHETIKVRKQIINIR